MTSEKRNGEFQVSNYHATLFFYFIYFQSTTEILSLVPLSSQSDEGYCRINDNFSPATQNQFNGSLVNGWKELKGSKEITGKRIGHHDAPWVASCL